MITRKIQDAWNEMLTSFCIVSLTGPRQSGKTTFLKESLPNYRYVSLENPEILEYAENDTKGFLAEYNDQVIFDEAQKVPKLFSYLQGIVDENNKNGQFVLSGSQNFLLSRNISQSLAGRVGILRLLPFQNNEITDQLNPDPWEQIFRGFYPELYKNPSLKPEIYYRNYIDTYVKRDVYELINIQNEAQFKLFLGILATHIGQELNLHSISKQTGISHTTAKNWLSILETSYLVFRLPPYFKNYNKRLIKSPKLYFYDTGLACQLLGLKNAKEVKNYRNKGSLFENLVVAEMIKQNYHTNQFNDFYFWKESHQTEIDVLIPKSLGNTIYEIKSSQTLSRDKFEGLLKFEQISTDPTLSKNLIHIAQEKPGVRYDCNTFNWRDLNLES